MRTNICYWFDARYPGKLSLYPFQIQQVGVTWTRTDWKTRQLVP